MMADLNKDGALVCMLGMNNYAKNDLTIWFLDSGASAHMTPTSVDMCNY